MNRAGAIRSWGKRALSLSLIALSGPALGGSTLELECSLERLRAYRDAKAQIKGSMEEQKAKLDAKKAPLERVYAQVSSAVLTSPALSELGAAIAQTQGLPRRNGQDRLNDFLPGLKSFSRAIRTDVQHAMKNGLALKGALKCNDIPSSQLLHEADETKLKTTFECLTPGNTRVSVDVNIFISDSSSTPIIFCDISEYPEDEQPLAATKHPIARSGHTLQLESSLMHTQATIEYEFTSNGYQGPRTWAAFAKRLVWDVPNNIRTIEKKETDPGFLAATDVFNFADEKESDRALKKQASLLVNAMTSENKICKNLPAAAKRRLMTRTYSQHVTPQLQPDGTVTMKGELLSPEEALEQSMEASEVY